MEVERKLEALGLALPPSVRIPPGIDLPFSRTGAGQSAYAAGLGTQNAHCLT